MRKVCSNCGRDMRATTGKIPGARIARLAEEIDDFLKRYPDPAQSPKLAAIRARIDATRDWTVAETVALLDEVTAIATAPVGWCELKETFAAMNKTKPGRLCRRI